MSAESTSAKARATIPPFAEIAALAFTLKAVLMFPPLSTQRAFVEAVSMSRISALCPGFSIAWSVGVTPLEAVATTLGALRILPAPASPVSSRLMMICELGSSQSRRFVNAVP